jgi:trimeric autotransporter adhesin
VTGIDPSDFSFTSTCSATLAPGKTCLVTVTFKPTAEGSLQATLSVLNATLGLTQSVSLYGTGTAVSLSPSSLNFGSEPVGQTSAAQTVTLTNEGTTTLGITAVNINGTDPADFAQTNNCGTSLGAGASCTINVTFTPTATGSRSAHLLVYDNGGGSPQITSLTGTGT